jgi:uncharacterized protein
MLPPLAHNKWMHVEEWKVQVGQEETSARLDAPALPPYEKLLVLAHSAGGHMRFRTMEDLTEAFLASDLPVVRFNFLYKELAKGPPDRMPRLIECWRSVIASVREKFAPKQLFVGGHSMGGRAASMMCAEAETSEGVAGLVLLGYPLHPAGQPEKLRDAHLPNLQVPALCLNGTRDDLCRLDLMEAVLERVPPGFQMHWLDGADHSFNVLKSSGRTRQNVFEEIAAAVNAFITKSA